jgi:hypothetical protein
MRQKMLQAPAQQMLQQMVQQKPQQNRNGDFNVITVD